MPESRFHGLGPWQGMLIVLARVLHQTADRFYGRGTALRGMITGRGREGFGKENQALKVS
jgi:hypothetical protein